MVALGAGGIDINEKGVLLMFRKGTKTFNNVWSNPGGSVDLGESAAEATAREHLEEVNTKVRVIEHISDYKEYEGDKLIRISSGFLVETVSGTPKIMEPHKVEDLKRFQLNNLPQNIAPYTKFFIEELIRTGKIKHTKKI